MTIVVLTNFAGVSPYDIAKALYEDLPDFICGNQNKKEDKIDVCFKGIHLCIDRSSAPGFIEKGGYLGSCNNALSTTESRQSISQENKMERQNTITASPNPFTNQVTLSFKSAQTEQVSVRIYDLSGRLVANLFNSVEEKGIVRKVNFNASKLPAGIYISRMQTASGMTEQKIVRTQ